MTGFKLLRQGVTEHALIAHHLHLKLKWKVSATQTSPILETNVSVLLVRWGVANLAMGQYIPNTGIARPFRQPAACLGRQVGQDLVFIDQAFERLGLYCRPAGRLRSIHRPSPRPVPLNFGTRDV
jgi:hypothetical protein